MESKLRFQLAAQALRYTLRGLPLGLLRYVNTLPIGHMLSPYPIVATSANIAVWLPGSTKMIKIYTKTVSRIGMDMERSCRLDLTSLAYDAIFLNSLEVKNGK
jgi:hypothetical protein